MHLNKYSKNVDIYVFLEKQMFEDTKGVRSRKSKKDRKYNGQKKNYKGTTMIYEVLLRKQLNIY